MPITQEELNEFNLEHGIPDSIELLSTSDYRDIVKSEAYFYEDPHGFLVHTLSNQVIAKNTEQLDVIIEQLLEFRTKIPRTEKQLSEK
ncbi:hypothetical protein PSI22_07695 [Xenorhabdus sp. XENO-7]|uniref:Uncharacterized protein n=1 Tax=Xenorhabdus aichiensis TaxID=3025874 RepID=A0ABT5M1H7_9GAMM|nr:hypothetical protein [Xenorhabdus aichiensis]MDC9621524.1 hypothetical protein [Xenorhabdus aichiensis]